MDHGTLTDTNGRKTDFRHTIFIMTSNAGADVLDKNVIGFTEDVTEGRSDVMSAVNRVFSPEFRNRLDAIIQFKPLDTRTILHVVNKFLMELEVQLESKHVVVEIDDEARGWLAVKGYDKKMGARPMARVIQEQIKRPLAEELLFGKLHEGGHVLITVVDGELKIAIGELEDHKVP
jgi:ATP-dependent Clp protease ATP-binding subunit ClpA